MGSLTRQSVSFYTEQTIYGRASAQPYVGFEHLTDLPDGWEFDIKRWASPFDLRLPTLPRLANPSTQGLNEEEYFDCGVGDINHDLYINYLEEIFSNHERLWVPNIDDGWYFRFKTDYFYYGDNSRVQTIHPDDTIDNRNYIELDVDFFPGKPILAASFKRDPETKTISYDHRVEQVAKFTGLWVDGEQLSTTTSGVGHIVWSSVDTTKNEFVVDRGVADVIALKFNKDYIYRVGVEPLLYGDLGAGDILGVADYTEWQLFFLSRFPVVTDSFKLYLVDTATQTWEECTRVDSYWDLVGYTTPPYGSYCYYLDKDLGRVVFGDLVTGLPPDGRYVVAVYDVTLRIEYEEKEFDTTITAWDANISPVTQAINEGFICITHEEIEAAHIELDINKNPIAFTNPIIYGPLYVGSDWATLQAKVTSVTGTSVPNTEVTFTMQPSTIGSIGGSTSGSAYSVTNGKGLAFSYYQPPVDTEEMGFYATSETAVQGNTLYLDNSSAGLTINDDIYLYKVLKDDPLLGTITVDDYLPEPPYWVLNGTAEEYDSWREEMIQTFDLEQWVSTPTPNGRRVIVYQWDADAINPALGTTGAFVPTRPLSINTDGGQLTYPSGALLPFDPYYESAYPPYYQDIGAYWVVTTKYVDFQASCWSPYYNRIIYSNTITIKVSLPRYLLGEYITEQLKKIPFGWKLYESAEKNHAAGLDGATFLTINPQPGPYEIIDFFVDTDGDGTPDFFEGYPYQEGSKTGTWVSATWGGIGIKFVVDI